MRTPDSFKSILQKAIAAPDTFTREDAQAAVEHLLDPASTHPAQIGSFLTAIHLNGLERRPDVLAGAASVLRKHCLPAIVNRGEGVEEIDEDGRRRSRRVVDIVGTGGDGHDTFNVSTTSAIVAAGAGARVYKVRLQNPKLALLTPKTPLSTETARRLRRPDRPISSKR